MSSSWFFLSLSLIAVPFWALDEELMMCCLLDWMERTPATRLPPHLSSLQVVSCTSSSSSSFIQLESQQNERHRGDGACAAWCANSLCLFSPNLLLSSLQVVGSFVLALLRPSRVRSGVEYENGILLSFFCTAEQRGFRVPGRPHKLTTNEGPIHRLVSQFSLARLGN